MQNLALDCPLRGRQLIEASAGTGKTYTLALLFLRLLLERGLEVNQILVVTFTEAATLELRDRIRQRLRDALDRLQHPDRDADPLLDRLLGQYPDSEAIKGRLADALVRMDEAAIYTIHGFCARMLQDHAFETGMAFELEMIGNDSDLTLALMRDFWRLRVAPLAEPDLEWLIGIWPTPDALLATLSLPLKQPQLRLLPEIGMEQMDLIWQGFEDQFKALGRHWQAERTAIIQLLNSPALNRKSYRTDVVTKAIAAMDALTAQDRPPQRLALTQIERFTPALLGQQTKPGEQRPQHGFFDEVQAFLEDHERAFALRKAAWLQLALTWLRERLEAHKAERHELAFGDLISRLAKALTRQDALGKRLAQQIRDRYPVGLIDEFQDTDATQYRIFDRIYPLTHQDGQPALLMIGDPKQAIYSFRGGDIFAYLEARQSINTTDRHNLDTNWRSSSGLVRAVNSLFGRSDIQRPFALEQGLDFVPVKHSPTADRTPLLIEGKAPPPLDIWLLEARKEDGQKDSKHRSKNDLQTESAQACAEAVVNWLNLAAEGKASLGDRPLRAQDIAILVRTHAEGDLVQAALGARGLVSISQNKDSIFGSDEAQQLQLLLDALERPGDEARLRLFLISPLMGIGLARMQALLEDESAWEGIRQALLDGRERWQHQGFMTALLGLIHRLGIPGRILAGPQGERRLTNLLHLAELLQEAAREVGGIDGLIKWYATELKQQTQTQERELRLESDENLVRIVTIHASKGLEYPLVLLPFAWLWQESAKDCTLHQDGGYFWQLIAPSPAQADQARAERLAERLRLLYVAITRARQHCLVFWGNMPNTPEISALAWLLHQKTPTSDQAPGQAPEVAIPERLDETREALKPLIKAAGHSIELNDWPEPCRSSYRPATSEQGQPGQLRAAQAQRPLRSNWRLTSYSGLVRSLEPLHQADTEQPDRDPDQAQDLDQRPETALGRFGFPKGPQIGSFLHGLLENIDFQTSEVGIISSLVERERRRHGIHDQWQSMLETWIGDILTTELNDQGLKLADIGTSDRLTEVAFHYPLASISAEGLRQLLGQHPRYRHQAQGLGFGQLEGMMRGFIDLVIRAPVPGQDGRYYILDYKSNHLGNNYQDYQAKALEAAMDQHHYRLQYLIYALALHRYLRLRLKGYDYRRHFGGVYYLFLRGMHPGSRSGIYFDRPEAELIEALDAYCTAGYSMDDAPFSLGPGA